jgi:hypothetical protein
MPEWFKGYWVGVFTGMIAIVIGQGIALVIVAINA